MKAKSLLDQWVDLKEDFPRHIVLIQCGVFYETYQEDAEFLSEISNIKTYLRNKKIRKINKLVRRPAHMLFGGA
jgi:DNA mismatch repair ATPase MutS